MKLLQRIARKRTATVIAPKKAESRFRFHEGSPNGRRVKALPSSIYKGCPGGWSIPRRTAQSTYSRPSHVLNMDIAPQPGARLWR